MVDLYIVIIIIFIVHTTGYVSGYITGFLDSNHRIFTKVDNKMKLTLSAEEAREVVYNSHKDWSTVKDTEEITDHSRWSVSYTAVFHHKPTNKYYRFDWSRGATEYQDEQAYEYDTEVEVCEVVEKEVVVKVWEGI